MDFEPLYHHCYRADNLKAGDRLPVGGSIFCDKCDSFLKLDSDEFYDFFQKTTKNAQRFANPQLKKWLENLNTDFDVNLFANLHAFNGVFQKMYPDASAAFDKRIEFYAQKPYRKLTEALDNKVMACAEIAALAQIYLQKSGVDSRYFSGEMMAGRKDEFADDHSFVTFEVCGKKYVFDAARPLQSENVYFPNINEIKMSAEQLEQFEQRIHPPKDADENSRYSAFMETENILTKQKTYYGVNDHLCVFEEFIYPQSREDGFLQNEFNQLRQNLR